MTLQTQLTPFCRKLVFRLNLTRLILCSTRNLITGSGDNDLQFKSCLLANVSYCPETKSDQFTLVVYNPLSRVVSSPISVPVDTETWSIVDPEGKCSLVQKQKQIFLF